MWPSGTTSSISVIYSSSVARLECTSRKAEASGQYGVVVSFVAQLNKMIALGADQKGFRVHQTHYYRR